MFLFSFRCQNFLYSNNRNSVSENSLNKVFSGLGLNPPWVLKGSIKEFYPETHCYMKLNGNSRN